MIGDKKGVTLIELLVVSAIFAIFITTSVDLLASALRYQRISLDTAYLLNTSSFVTEYVSRALRMAKKDIAGDCITPKTNFEVLANQEHIIFKNYKNECQEFFLEDEMIKVRRLGVTQPLTPSNLRVSRLKFNTIGEVQDDGLQPKITFNLALQTKTSLSRELNLQTTVSQRQLDITY